MKRFQHFALLVLVIALFVCVGCGHTDQPVQSNLSATNLMPGAPADQGTNALSQDEQKRREALAEAMAYAEKLTEERMRDPKQFAESHPSWWPFPNYPAGPGNPLPPYVNFYSMNDHYPAYLLCEYQVDEEHYNQSGEPGWFKVSLEQIRKSGPNKFPSIKWVAVIIENDAEWKVGTIDQAHKVGIIFKASDVFGPSYDLSQLVAHADMDRHPFKYDPSQPTPGDQDRWLIVERHATTNIPATEPKY